MTLCIKFEKETLRKINEKRTKMIVPLLIFVRRDTILRRMVCKIRKTCCNWLQRM